jgi:bacteriocin-like protein
MERNSNPKSFSEITTAELTSVEGGLQQRGDVITLAAGIGGGIGFLFGGGLGGAIGGAIGAAVGAVLSWIF